jgi:RNA polymerase sigma-70 factor (ECF subfamily)
LAKDVYRYAYSLCRHQAQAEDLTQETFLRAWRFLEGLRDDRKAKSWLFTTVRREFFRQFERYQPIFEEIDPERTPALDQPEMETWMLQRSIENLPAKYRDVLLLQIIGGYSGQEIADVLEIPRATVNTRLFRARAKLRHALDLSPSKPSAKITPLRVISK